MSGFFASLIRLTLGVLQRLTMLVVVVLAVGLTGYSIAAAFGFAPWLTMPLALGDTAPVDAGMWVQIGVAALFVGLAAYLPSNTRIMRLETSHRSFHMGMNDVAQAYAVCHAADRTGPFRLKSEFDSVRERIAFLRDHPDLSELEPSVLEVAAQMSHISRDLAQVYSDSSVHRARDFLTQRQDEIEQFTLRLDEAKGVAAEIRQWSDRIEVEESVAASQLQRVTEELRALLPEVFDPAPPPQSNPATEAKQPDLFTDDPTVTPITRKAAE